MKNRTITRIAVSLLLTTALVVSAVPILPVATTAYAKKKELTTGICGQVDDKLSDNVRYSFDSSTGTLTITGSGEMYDYYDRTEREEVYSPFTENSNKIKTVIINEGITTIGVMAFYACDHISSVTIPDSVTGLGNDAFYGCSHITSLTLPDSITYIGPEAFCSCSNLTSVNIPKNISEIDSEAFYECYKITSLTIPDNVSLIGDNAFTKICNVNYNGSLTSKDNWGARTLNGYEDENGLWYYDEDKYYLTACPDKKASVLIPDSVTSIGDYAFYQCNNITSITLPDGLTDIGVGAFFGCSRLTGISIPDSVVDIYDYAFFDCNSLAEVRLPEGLKEINKNTFLDCSSLASINIPSSVTSIDYYAFSGCTSLTTINIPDSVTTIDERAFSGCTSLKTVNIPKSVTNIGEYAFYDCTSLETLNIPDSIKTIDTYTFSGCASLETLNIPGSVTNIEVGAFSGCTNLKTVNIPDSVTSIEGDAFSYCTRLKSINIPGSVKSLHFDVFYECTSLTSVTFADGVKEIYNIFEGCKNLKELIILGSDTSLEIDCSKLNHSTRIWRTIPTVVIKGLTGSQVESEALSDNYLKFVSIGITPQFAKLISNIKSSSVRISKVSSTKGKLKINVKKATINGVKHVRYQYAVRKKGTKSWKTYKSSKTSYTVSKLTSKKKYQLRTRPYVILRGKSYYGKWSGTLTRKVI